MAPRCHPLRRHSGIGRVRGVRAAATGCLLALIFSTILATVAVAQHPQTNNPLPISPRHQSMLESVRQYSAVHGPQAAFCFAPDTPQELVNQFDEAMWGQTLVQYRAIGRWTATATDGAGLALGDPTTLTYSFAPDGTPINGLIGGPATSDLRSFLTGIFGDEATWQAVMHGVFTHWGELTGITYVYEPNDDGAPLFNNPGVLGVRGDIRIGAQFLDGDFGVLAYCIFPNNGDMVLDSGDFFFFSDLSLDALNLRNVVAHEHGHGIGLMHVCPLNETKLMEPFVSAAFDGPQHDDIQGAQRLYGDPLENNDNAASASGLGAYVDERLTVANVSLDDFTDQDFYSFTVAGPRSLAISLKPVGFNYEEAFYLFSCPTPQLRNSLAVQDLAFQVLDTDGVGVLATASAKPLGQGEVVANLELPAAGTYTIRVFSPGVLSDVQLYELNLGPNDLELNLAINGMDPAGGVVATAGPVQLTLDMAPGLFGSHELDWYFAYFINNTLVWVTSGGLSLSPAPLLRNVPVPLQDLTLVNTVLPAGTDITFAFLLVNGSEIVASDIIAADVEPVIAERHEK